MDKRTREGMDSLIYGRGKEVVGPVLARLIGLVTLGAAGVLVFFFAWAVNQLLNRAQIASVAILAILAVSAAFATFFLVISARLLIFGGNSRVQVLSPRAWVAIGALLILGGGTGAIIFLFNDQPRYALDFALSLGMLAVLSFMAAQISIGRRSSSSTETDYRKVDITWAGIRDWAIRKRITISITLGLTVVVWGIANELARSLNPYPGGFSGFTTIEYASNPTYEILRKGATLVAERSHGTGSNIIFIVSFYFVAFFVVDGIRALYNGRNANRPSSHHPISHPNGFSLGLLFLYAIPATLLGFYGYYWVWPAFEVVAFPQVYVFEPARNTLFYNGKAAARLNDIVQFDGYYKRLTRSSYGEFGVEMRDGNYYRLDSGVFVNSDVNALASYLNDYLKNQTEK